MSRRDKRAQRASGPLAPWKFLLALAATTAATGPQLVDAATSGEQLEAVLGRSLGLGTVVWLALGGINRILAQAEMERLAGGQPTSAEAEPADGAILEA